MYIQKCGVIVMYKKESIVQYLIVYSKKSGKYGFPKGGRENKESIETTAERELYEETGYRIKNKKDFSWSDLSNFRIKNNFYYILEFGDNLNEDMEDDGIQDTNEILYKKWMTLEELVNIPINKKNFGLNHYIKYLQQHKN